MHSPLTLCSGRGCTSVVECAPRYDSRSSCTRLCACECMDVFDRTGAPYIARFAPNSFFRVETEYGPNTLASAIDGELAELWVRRCGG